MKIFRTQEGSETWDDDGKLTSCEIQYIVTDPASKSAAIREILNSAPQEVNGALRTSVRFDGYDSEGNLEISVVYEKDNSVFSENENESAATMSFDCTGGTKHITHAISQKKAWGIDGGSSDDTGGAIGWNGKTGAEMEITGCDIATGQLRESYEKTMRMSSITTAKKRTWCSLVGKVNANRFKGWEPGEVMFLGCSFSGSSNSKSKIRVQFNFSIQENESNAKINGKNCGRKDGFQVIWAMSDTKKGQNDVPVVDVKGIYIATVCEYGNFDLLGI